MTKHPKKTHRRRRSNRMDDDEEEEEMMSFGARRRVPMFGGEHMMPDGTMMDNNMMSFGNYATKPTEFEFGKRRQTGAKVSKAKAMKAFRSFWKRHCKGRGSQFGNGGNPMLSSSMGYEFCPNGMGGVLGANSTGLFPSPCMSSSSSGAAKFGKRRRQMCIGPIKTSKTSKTRKNRCGN